MNEKNSVRPRGSLGVILVVMLGGGMFCVTRPAEVPTPGDNNLEGPPEKLSPECLARLQAEQDLARLAVEAMRTYGRIDPGLFDTTPSPDTRQLIRVSPNAKPLEPSAAVAREGEALQRFNERLGKINDGPDGTLAAKLFLKAHAAAQQRCGEKCPPTVYPIQVASVEQGPDSELYSFEVQGDKLPSLVEWEQGFLAQYASVRNECSFAAPLQLKEAVEQKAALPSARQMLGTGSSTSSVRGGYAEARLRCDEGSHAACASCQTAQNNNGGYKITVFGACCYASCG
jgi:hypothetical protein